MAKKTHSGSMISIKDFSLPAYTEIPDVGLYLEQTTKFVSDCLSPVGSISITSSMISNYVKKGLVANPVKKQYYRDQIASILFIAIAKTVISMEEIQLLLDLQASHYETRQAYEYFCSELMATLGCIFEGKEYNPPIGGRKNPEKQLLRNVILTVAHKIYLDSAFCEIQELIRKEASE